jgi:outer membrane receptor for ferrienterochelin and colicins
MSPRLLIPALCWLALGAAEEAVPVDHLEVVGSVEQLDRLGAETATVGVDNQEAQRFADDSIGQTMRRMPGVTHTGPPGVVKDVRVRGTPKGFTQIRLEGQPVTSGTADRQAQVDILPPGLVTAVELSHLPTADQPHDAIAGAFDVQLRPIPATALTGVGVGVSRHRERTGAAATWYAGDGRGPVGWLLGVGGQRAWLVKDDTEVTTTSAGAPKSRKDKPETARNDELDALVRLRRQLGHGLSIGLDGLVAAKEEDKEKTESTYGATGLLTERKVKLAEVKDNVSGQITGWSEGTWGAHHLRLALTVAPGSERKDPLVEDTWRYNPAGAVTGRDHKEVSSEFKTDLGTRAALGHRWQASDHVAPGWGVALARSRHDEGKSERIESRNAAEALTRVTENEASFTGDERIIAGYVRATIQVHDHTFIPGLRGERRLRTIEAEQRSQTRTSTAVPWTVTAQSGDDRADDVVLLPSLHWSWEVAPGVVTRAGAARLMRRPAWGDLSPLVTTKAGTVVDPDTAGNAGLGEEQAWGAEVGAQTVQDALGLEAGVTLWRRWLDEVIQKRSALEGTRWVSRPQNVGTGHLMGLETDLRVALDPLVPGLSPWGNWAVMDSEVDDPLLGEIPLQEQHRWAWTVGLDQRFGRTGWSVGAAWNERGPSRTVDNTKTQEEAAFGLLDAYVAWNWRAGWETRLTGGNLTDTPRQRTSVNSSNGDRTVQDEDAGPTVAIMVAGEW